MLKLGFLPDDESLILASRYVNSTGLVRLIKQYIYLQGIRIRIVSFIHPVQNNNLSFCILYINISSRFIIQAFLNPKQDPRTNEYYPLLLEEFWEKKQETRVSWEIIKNLTR